MERLITSNVAIVKATNEHVQITDTVLRVYLYMWKMHKLSTLEGKPYCESYVSIANAIGKEIDLFKKGVNRPDKVLEKIGLLKQERGGKGRASVKILYDLEDVEDFVYFTNTYQSDIISKDDLVYGDRVCMVYKLYRNGTLCYIGRTIDIDMRLNTHTKYKDFDEVYYTKCENAAEMKNLEGFLIQQLKPPLNLFVPNDSVKFKLKPSTLNKTFIRYPMTVSERLQANNP